MNLDPEAGAVLAALGPDMTVAGRSVQDARAAMVPLARLVGPAEPVSQICDLTVPGYVGDLWVRLYRPRLSAPAPLVVFFHGGGWVLGGIEASDRPCRLLAHASRSVVASVEYRLSPEVKFPGPVEDCYAATRWLGDHAADLGVDSRRLAIVGESAGGNLAAAVALMARDRGGPRIDFQTLIYPALAYRAQAPSLPGGDHDGRYLFSPADLAWFWGHYLASPVDGVDPYAAPLVAEHLRGLPSACVITAEFDPLRQEGHAYARRLADAGVPTKHSDYAGAIHGIYSMAGVMESGRRLHAEVGRVLSAALATDGR